MMQWDCGAWGLCCCFLSPLSLWDAALPETVMIRNKHHRQHKMYRFWKKDDSFYDALQREFNSII